MAAGAALLCLTALYNGFPLVFSDTGTYLEAGIRWTWPWDRPPFYGYLIAPLHWRLSLWPVVGAQGLLLSHLISVTTRVALPDAGARTFLAIVATLALFTALPWFVGQIMPDVFTPVVVLCIFLLGFGLDRLTRAETVYLCVLGGVAAAVHLSHVPLAIVRGTLLAHPGWCLALALRHTLAQLASFSTGAELTAYRDGTWVHDRIRARFPAATYARYLASRQQTGRLPLEALRRLHAAAFAAAVLGGAALLAAAVRRRAGRLAALFCVTAAGLLINAASAGALAGTEHRYQSRVAWLAVLCGALGALSQRAARSQPEPIRRICGPSPTTGGEPRGGS